MKRLTLLSAPAIAAAVSIAVPVAAQDAVMALSPTTMVGYAGTAAAGRQLNNRVAEQVARPGGAAVPRGAAGAVRIDPAALRYRPSIAQRKKNFAQFVAKTRQKDPDTAAKMEKLFATTDVIEQMRPGLTALHLSVDNLADAYTLWWIDAWQASRGVSDNLPVATIETVKAQAARALLATPELARATDATKQEMAESFFIQASMIESYMEKAKGNAPLLRQIAGAVRQGARGAGLDLDAMNLTPRGFVPARG
jgi:hypothetical protein